MRGHRPASSVVVLSVYAYFVSEKCIGGAISPKMSVHVPVHFFKSEVKLVLDERTPIGFGGNVELEWIMEDGDIASQ